MSVLRYIWHCITQGGKRDTIREEEVEQTLDRHEDELEEMAQRVRRLEAEAGIYYPPDLKEVNET